MSTTLVEASAGTGKTWRITQIVAEQVVSGVPIERILVVTFTEAATAELRTRVRRRLTECAAGFRAALAGAPSEVDPDLAALLAQHADALPVVFTRLQGALQQFDLATICTLHGFCQRMLSRFALESAAPFDVSPTGDARAVAREVALDWWTAETSDLPDNVVTKLDWRFTGRSQDGAPTELVRLAEKLAEDPDLELVPPATSGLLEGAKPAEAPLAAVLGLAAVARSRIGRRLARARTRTFDDLLVRLRDAVRDPATAPALLAAVREAYAVALVDEFQDTDPVQWAIFRTLFHGHADLWLIGDPKQAIYGFRRADVHTYLQAAAVEGVERAPSLDRNHRSDIGLVRAVNHLFGRLRAPYVDLAIPHRPVTAHHERRLLDEGGPPLVVRFLPRAVRAVSLGTEAEREIAAKSLARICAFDVTTWLGSGARLLDEGGSPRPCAPRDVAVLTRTNEEARLVRDALRGRGVPVVTRTDERVFDSPVASELLTVLRAVADPGDDSLRARALLTSLLGRSLADLADLSVDDAGLSAEVARFRRWQGLWEAHGFAATFQALLGDAGVPERLLASADGPRRLGDLLHLGELIHAWASQGRGPSAIVQWLADGGPGAGEEAQTRLEADDDAVTVLTVHKAKGLEWPIVFCPFLCSNAYVGPSDEHLLRVRLPDGRHLLDVRSADHPEKDERLGVARREAFAEVVRLAYVALTRARHRTVITWGAFEDAGRSALAWLFHQDPAAPEDRLPDATRFRFEGLSEDEVLADLEAICAGSGGTIGLSRVSSPPGSLAFRHEEPPALDARALVRRTPLDLLWRRSSFSRLTKDSWTEHAGRKDGRDADPADAGPAIGADLRPVPLALVPSFGTALGDATHGALEKVDFTAPVDLEDLVRAGCLEHGVPVDHAPAVAAALRGVLATPLLAEEPSFTLSAVPRVDRRSELDFHLPVAGGFARGGRPLEAGTLADALEAHPDPAVPADYAAALRGLAWAPLRGFLNGSIDLVVRREGRVWVADYKSNHVGPVFGSFTAEALADTMATHHYVLQGLLYAVAVARWMRVRDPSWRYDAHFGGVLYLFLRGMTPQTGAARGIWRWRPHPGLVDAVDLALGGRP